MEFLKTDNSKSYGQILMKFSKVCSLGGGLRSLSALVLYFSSL